ncbi:TonB dependent/Ligand-Gated channel TonB [Mesorhizobium tianshanense]|uniref:Iron complex outermembrane receptor protein n=1 Tax=Mesorhizobium tianshanense TaxID=39844 RepID=A0A562MLG3_9HYPH|nr:TonB-dependent siderophore receptor [Mesorhizobium tianshanense]TWI20765.1 iron complex outermembrane receptor protein [Mesorhizobium tianshanense]GLS35112.1 TonB dependent/Ligand-Gated channel TonB [Mesorhizobium tianshanense]
MEKRVGFFAALVVMVVHEATAQEATQLERIVVEALGGVPLNATIGTLPEEYPGGQVARGGRMGVLGNRDVMDTPFNIGSYTAQTIEDQGARTVADVMINDPSVRSTHSSGGMLDSFYIRGFPINEGNFGEIAFDGVFGIAPAYRVFTDYAERIEVLKGPAALLYGISPNSSVGGTINIVPKRAGDVDLTRFTADYASSLQGGGHVDVSRRFGAERQFGVRFNGSYHGGDTPIDNQTREVSVGALALDYQGERLRATLDVIGQREDFEAPQRPFYPLAGFAIPDAPDARLNIQQPWEGSTSEDLSLLGRVEYDLTDEVTLFAAAGGGNSRVERLFGTPIILNSAGDISVTPQNYVFDVDRRTAETGLRAHFDTAGIDHLVTLQASYFHQGLDRGFNSGTAQFTNIYDPVSRPAQDVPAPTSVPTVSENELYGFALADTLSMLDEQVQLTLGARWQHVGSENFDATTGAVTSSSDEGVLTPLVGLVVKPWENVSLYANYVEGLSIGDTAPGLAVNAGETLPPYRSRQFELGTKIDFGRVAVTVSAFQIEKPFGQLEARGSDLVFVEGGEQRSRGLEFNVFGEVTPQLRLLGGLTLLVGELTKTASAETRGNTPVGVPSVQLNLGAEWDTPFLPGLTLAANVIHTGSQFVDAANTQEIPSWTRLDLGARYLTEINDRPVTFRASVENVFDNDYWAGVASYGTLAQGAPLTVKLSMTTDF